MKKETANKIVTWLYDYAPDYSVLVFGVLYGLGQLTITEEALELLSGLDNIDKNSLAQFVWRRIGIGTMVISGIILLASSIILIVRQRRMSTLVEKNQQLQSDVDLITTNYKSMTEGYIRDLAKNKLGFGNRAEKCERITVYHHDSVLDKFVPFGRFSYNPLFDKLGRPIYPDNQGCIAKAWENGRSFNDDYPDFVTDPDKYVTAMEKEGYSRDQILPIKMKSRLYFGWRILDTRQNKPLAVIIVESTIQDRWSETKLNKVFEAENTALSEFVEKLKDVLPKISNAREDGV